MVTIAPDGKKGQAERGAFYTPDLLAQAVCNSLFDEGIEYPRSVLEPGCGGGSFLRAANATWPAANLIGIDLVPACTGPGSVVTGDFLGVVKQIEGWDLIVGNPDFGQAEAFIRRSLELVRPGGHVAFLLRLSMLGTKTRVALYTEYPLFSLQPITPRPSFIGGATDSSEYGKFVWQRGFQGRGSVLPPLVWK
jgi:hypothetical protein